LAQKLLGPSRPIDGFGQGSNDLPSYEAEMLDKQAEPPPSGKSTATAANRGRKRQRHGGKALPRPASDTLSMMKELP
jgi:hypothetical protein